MKRLSKRQEISVVTPGYDIGLPQTPNRAEVVRSRRTLSAVAIHAGSAVLVGVAAVTPWGQAVIERAASAIGVKAEAPRVPGVQGGTGEVEIHGLRSGQWYNGRFTLALPDGQNVPVATDWEHGVEEVMLPAGVYTIDSNLGGPVAPGQPKEVVATPVDVQPGTSQPIAISLPPFPSGNGPW